MAPEDQDWIDEITLEEENEKTLEIIMQQEGQTTPVGPLYRVITVVAMVVQDVWNHYAEYMMMNEYTRGVFLLYIFLEVETGFSSLVRFPLFIAS